MSMTEEDINRVLKFKQPEISKGDIAAHALKNPNLIFREQCNRSLFYFVKFFWSTYSNDEFVPNWHIEKVLCPALEEIAYNVGNNVPRKYDLLINVPPGTSKTAVVSIFFPLWCWTKWYWMKFITASYTEKLSLESAEYSRDVMRSQLFQLIYPDLDIKADKDTKGNFKIIKRVFEGHRKTPTIFNGGNRYSTSVGGTLTGFHGHILIFDDPIDPHGATSDAMLTDANHWISQTLSTRKANKLTTTTIGVMQRLHQNDPSGALLANKKKIVKHICLPGEIRTFRDKVNPPELIKYYTDDLLDAKRMPWSVMDDLKADLGQYGYAGQIGQNPTPPGGGMFHVDEFQKIDTMPDPRSVESIIRYWDKAGTQGDGCYTAGVKMAKLKNGKYIIIDIIRGQWSTERRENIIRNIAEADGTIVDIWIEQEPGSGGKESAEATIRNLAGYCCYKENPKGDKIYRADPFSVQVNNGNVMLLKGDWIYEFVEEVRFFPYSTYKDQVDSASGAFAKLASKRTVVIL